MYYLTVDKDGEELVHRMPFEDYSDAIKYLSMYYEPRVGRGTLPFTTEVTNGKFARSYAELADPDTINKGDEGRYLRSVKLNNAFKYEGSYFFLIESEVGIQDIADDEGDDE